MKRLLPSLIAFSMICSAHASELDQWKKDYEAVWRTGSGAEDGTFTAIATSMLGWGIGLSVGAAILASALHQSAASHSHTHCNAH